MDADGTATEDYYVWQGITLKKVINAKDGKTISEAVSITQPARSMPTTSRFPAATR